MKVFEDLNIVITDDFEEGRRVNGKIPVILSEPYNYTAQDLDKAKDDYKFSAAPLNDEENLIVSLDFSCAIIIGGTKNSPTGVILHGEEKDAVELLSGLFNRELFEGVLLQRVVRASKRAILNIYREVFKVMDNFGIMDKNGHVHCTSIIMDLDKLYYSTDVDVNLDEFFKLLHSDIEPIKVDVVSELGGVISSEPWFKFGNKKNITSSSLAHRKTYELIYDGRLIGSFELFGRYAKKQMHVVLNTKERFYSTKLREFKDALQLNTLCNLNGWVIILNYNDGIEEVAEPIDDTSIAKEENKDDVPELPDTIELVLEEEDKPIFLNFTGTSINVEGHIVVRSNGRYSLDGVTGAVVDFTHPAESFALINDLIYGGIECIFYLRSGVLCRYDSDMHQDSITEVSRDLGRRGRENRRFGFLTEGLEDRRRDSVSHRRGDSLRGDARRRRFGRD